MPATLIKPVDFVELSLASTLSAGTTSSLTVVEDISALESQGWIVVVDADNGDEVIYYSGKDNGTKTLSGLTRAVAGADVTHGAAKTIYLTTSAQYVIQLVDRLNSLARADSMISVAASELTIASGAVTVSQSVHSIDTEADATIDDLDTISGGTNGDVLILRAENSARTIVLKHATGNIKTNDGRDITLDSSEQYAILHFDGTSWLIVAFYEGKATGTFPIPVMATQMTPATTDGCGAVTTIEMGAGKPDVHVREFDHASSQHAMFCIPMPKAWDGGSISFKTIYMHGGGQTGGLDGVAWALRVLATGDTDSVNAAYGTEQTVTKDAAAASTHHETSQSAAITPAGSPQSADTLHFDLWRDHDHASDDLDVNAQLMGIVLYFTTSKLTDD